MSIKEPSATTAADLSIISAGKPRTTPLPLFFMIILLVSAFNMGDRLLLGIVAEPIKQEFGLTDTMMGLLGGTAFALIYPPLGLPIAALADRFNRKNILAVCMAVWSLATSLSALATGYLHLLAARLTVAAGEAGFVPPTHSLIADYVTERFRARAFSVIAVGAALGSLMANVGGGALADAFGWRAAFLAMGGAGLLVAVTVALFVREPPRFTGVAGKGPVERSVIMTLLRNRAFMFCVMGSAFHLMYNYAAATWSVPFYTRVYDKSLLEAGIFVGIGGAVATALGGIAGGFAGDWFGNRDRRWLAFWPALTMAMAVPFGAAGYLAGNAWAAFALLIVATFLNALYQSSTYALVQSQVGSKERATAAALMIFLQNLLGLGLGPLLVGWGSDMLQPHVGIHALAYAMGGANFLNIIGAALLVGAGLHLGRPYRPEKEAP